MNDHYDGNPNNEPVDIVCPGCKRSNLKWIDRGDGRVECPRCEFQFMLYPQVIEPPITSATELYEASLKAENELLRGQIKIEQAKYARAVDEMETGLLELYQRLVQVKRERNALAAEAEEARRDRIRQDVWERDHA